MPFSVNSLVLYTFHFLTSSRIIFRTLSSIVSFASSLKHIPITYVVFPIRIVSCGALFSVVFVFFKLFSLLSVPGGTELPDREKETVNQTCKQPPKHFQIYSILCLSSTLYFFILLLLFTNIYLYKKRRNLIK